MKMIKLAAVLTIRTEPIKLGSHNVRFVTDIANSVTYLFLHLVFETQNHRIGLRNQLKLPWTTFIE